MPKPRKGESRAEYIRRAIKYIHEKEGVPLKQAIGKAYGLWKYYHKKGRKKRVRKSK